MPTFTDKDAAGSALQMLQWDYADGVGDKGPVIREFSTVLARYHKNFCQWKRHTDTSVAEKREQGVYDNHILPMLITSAVVFAVYLLLFVLLHSGIVLQIIFYVAASIALAIASENVAFGIFFGTLTGILSFVSGKYQTYIVAGFLVIYILYSLHERVKQSKNEKRIDNAQKKKQESYASLNNSLYSDREKLRNLLPKLRAEYADLRNRIIRENPQLFTEKEKQYLFATLPEQFWWEITPEELEAVEDSIGNSRIRNDVVWETRWVKRDARTAFRDAGEEYAPINSSYVDEDRDKESYNARREKILDGNGYVLDFITRGTSSVMETETVEVVDYKYSDSTKSDVNFLLFLAAHKIDNDYKEGRVSEEQYAKNIGAFAATMAYADERMDEKVTNEHIEYHQVKSHTNLWAGQILLCNDETSPSGDGLAIVDYRCQLYQVLRNIESLSDVKVTRVLGNVMERDPVVMAKIHKICELCR